MGIASCDYRFGSGRKIIDARAARANGAYPARGTKPRALRVSNVDFSLSPLLPLSLSLSLSLPFPVDTDVYRGSCLASSFLLVFLFSEFDNSFLEINLECTHAMKGEERRTGRQFKPAEGED
ncbi:hypothetical protein LY76DRAFT_298524 [Colletotrichum caudatum]|nr:hypothetical protein LY76DRAFT_298524 [Colletotrichum caudatum]